MNIKVKKLITSLVIISLICVQMGLPWATAYAAPDLPDRPGSTENADTPDSPDLPDNAPTVTPAPQPTQAPAPTTKPTNSPTPIPTNSPSTPQPANTPAPNSIGAEEEEEILALSQTSPTPSPQGIVENGQVGDSEIESGDSQASGSIINEGNSNSSVSPAQSGTGGIAISNDQNGTGSNNSGSATVNDTTNTNQGNAATLNNSLEVSTNSGNNQASENVGNSSIETGDADTTGTIFNAVNTNVAGLMVSEFNIVDDHVGDYELDFAANCIVGCGGASIANTNNGSDSINSGDIDTTTTNNTFQNNDAVVENELILTANTGYNVSDNNTAGDSSIETGDANVAGNVVNFVNNNFAGGVVYGVVNIFGDLVGDIVIPESVLASLGINNSDNGAGSTNTGEIDTTEVDSYNQFNNAQIVNNLDLIATTGDNVTSDNTDGDNTIKTGDADIEAQVINIANTNVIGDNWWLVIVNEAGNWVGKIIGAPGSAIQGLMAASQGTGFNVTDDGTINVTNANNGSNSTNTGSVSNTAENTIDQTNNAAITNNILLDANTGGNSASRNTGGDNSIETGDANIVVNIVNFVNNNFIGGNALVTVVNVFGSWLGDFVTPGAEKAVTPIADSTAEEPARGGSEEQVPTTASEQENDQEQNANTQSSSTSTTKKNPVKLAAVGFFGGSAGSVLGTSTEETSVSLVDEPLPSTPEPMVKNKKTVRINLAWLLPVALGALSVTLLKRKLYSRAK